MNEPTEACSFCNRVLQEVKRMIHNQDRLPATYICNLCVSDFRSHLHSLGIIPKKKMTRKDTP